MVLSDNCACPRIEVYSQSGEKDHPDLYGIYSRRAEKVNGRTFYTSDSYGGRFGIWWTQDDTYPTYQWEIGYSSDASKDKGWAINLQDVDCPQNLKRFSWLVYIDKNQQWRRVGYSLGIRCLSDDGLKNQKRKPGGPTLDAIAPSSHAQSHAETEIFKIMTLFISKP